MDPFCDDGDEEAGCDEAVAEDGVCSERWISASWPPAAMRVSLLFTGRYVSELGVNDSVASGRGAYQRCDVLARLKRDRVGSEGRLERKS